MSEEHEAVGHAAHGVASVPCAHLVEAPEPHCHIARRFPHACAACPAYSPGLTQQERVRCEVWTRVMGPQSGSGRPVSAFNPGKQSEHAERQYFRERPQAVVAPAGEGLQVVIPEPGEVPQPSARRARLQWW